MSTQPKAKEKYVGQPVERIEDETLLRGLARYADDYPVRPNTLYGAILRSPHAHAEIVSMDTSKARAQPGVAGVITGEDVQQHTDPFLNVIKQPMPLWALAVDRVRYVGEAVVLVLAKDRYLAEDALDHIDVTYKVLEPAVEPVRAAEEDAPLIHPDCASNVMSDRDFEYGDPERAFAECDKHVKLTVDYPRSSLTPMEGYVVAAEYHQADGVYDVLANFQGPYSVHPVMSRALRVTNTKLRIRTPANSGGGFGIKVAIFPYIVLMGVAARITGKPVKWVEDRYEHLASATAAPNRVVHIEAAAMRDGRVTGLRYDQLEDYGAFLRAPMPGPLYRIHGVLTGAYHIEHLAVRNRVVMTNKCPSGMVRGFGGAQMYFALERVMHRVAVELGLDPLDVMRKNLIPADAFPYKAAAGGEYDSGDYPKAVEIGVREGGLEELKRRRDEARAEGRLYGIGYATVVENTHSNMGYITTILPPEERAKKRPTQGTNSYATVNIDPFGGVSATSDVPPQGQGHGTILAQIIADQLGITPQEITCNLEFDTQKDKWSISAGNYAARFMSGPAVAAHLAAVAMREKLARIAAQKLNVPEDEVEFADGMIFARGNPDNAEKFSRVASTAHWSPGSLPDGMEGGLSETAVWTPPQLTAPTTEDRINTSLTYSYTFDYCGVEIDRDTGVVRIDHYVTMHDAGTIFNPLIVEGQILGSYSHSVGSALYEEFVYGEDGSFKSGTFADYLVPTAYEVPAPVILHMETPSPVTPLGAKGIADSNCMSTPVCLANAVCDALDIEHVDLPLYPKKISALIHGEEPPPPAGKATPEAAPGAAEAAGSALTVTGESVMPAAPEAVWQALLDPQKLAAVIPGCHRLDLTGENEYAAEVSLGVGPVRGRFEAQVRLTELDPPRAATLSGELAGPLGAAKGAGKLRLEPVDGGTRVSYDYSVEITGKVAAVGGRMLEGAAKVVVGQLFDRLGAQVGGGEGSGERTAHGPSPGASWWQRLLKLLGIGS